MPRRSGARRRSLDDSLEQESTSLGTIAPALTDERRDARLTELLIAGGPDGPGRNLMAVPPTSVARLQRLAGNRAVADRFAGDATVQRVPDGAPDEEEIPEAAEAGPVETTPEAGEIESTATPAAPAEGEPVTGEAVPEDPGHEVLPEAGEIESTATPAAPTEGEPVTGQAVPEDPGHEVLPEAGEIESTATPAAPTEGEPTTGQAVPEDPGHEVLPEAGEIESTAQPAEPEAGPVTGEVLPEAGSSLAAEVDQGEPLPAGDQAQIAVLNAAGANAATTAAKATAGTQKLSAVAVGLATAGLANALRLTTSRAVQWRTKIMGFVPKVASKAARMLTSLRTNASKVIRNIALRVKSVADAAKGVITWARRALGLARAAVRGIGSRLRSALGGVGEVVLKLLSSLLAPARKALGGLLKAGSEILLDGIRRVRASASSAVAFVAEEVGTRLEAALAKVVGLVRTLVRATLERARQAMVVIHAKTGAIRSQLLGMMLLARSMLLAARARANQGTSAALSAIATAIANGYPMLRSAPGRAAFRRTAKMWRVGVRGMRASAKGRLAWALAIVKLHQGTGTAVVGGARDEARANYDATRTSLTNLETTAELEAGELAMSVGVAAALVAGAIETTVTDSETLVREIAGEGDGDARELQGLINRVGK